MQGVCTAWEKGAVYRESAQPGMSVDVTLGKKLATGKTSGVHRASAQAMAGRRRGVRGVEGEVLVVEGEALGEAGVVGSGGDVDVVEREALVDAGVVVRSGDEGFACATMRSTALPRGRCDTRTHANDATRTKGGGR